MLPQPNILVLAYAVSLLLRSRSATCFTIIASSSKQRSQHVGGLFPSSTSLLFSSSISSTSTKSTTTTVLPSSALVKNEIISTPTNSSDGISNATFVLRSHDEAQRQYMTNDGNRGVGGGYSAYMHILSLDAPARSSLRESIRTLIRRAHDERDRDSSLGRIMLGICASNAPEALGGLKSWVSNCTLPRGMLHGMDIDGTPIPVEELGSVYIKYSTGGAMTYGEIRRSRRGFDALWRPGDALLETYDGDFRGVYLNVELSDGVFRQFGLLPTDLFMIDDEEDW